MYLAYFITLLRNLTIHILSNNEIIVLCLKFKIFLRPNRLSHIELLNNTHI